MKTRTKNPYLAPALLVGFSLMTHAPAIAQSLFATGGTSGNIYQFGIQSGAPTAWQTTFACGLGNATGVTFDTRLNSDYFLYVADASRGSIFRFTGGGAQSTFASGLKITSGLASDDEGNLYVADNNLLYQYSTREGKRSFSTYRLSHATGMACDHSRNLYVANGNGTILKFGPSGGNPTTFAFGLTVSDTFALAFDSSGNLFVSDMANNTILEYGPSGGNQPGTFFSGLNAPTGLAFDSSGILYEADSGSSTIFQFTPGASQSTFASGVTGLAQLASMPCESGLPLAAETLLLAGNLSGNVLAFEPIGNHSVFASGLTQPVGLAFDGSGDAFVGDIGNGKVYKFTPGGAQSTVASGLSPANLAADSDDNVYVDIQTGNGAGNILKINQYGIQTTFATGLTGPTGMTFDNAGNLYVADGNGNVNEFSAGGGQQSTFATQLPAQDTILLAFDNAGNLFALDEVGGTISKFAAGGTPPLTPTPFTSGLSAPTGLACDSDGDVFVANSGTSSIFKYTPDGTQFTFGEIPNNGNNGLGQIAFQPPIPYGDSPFFSSDPEQGTALPFYNSLAYLSNIIYAVSGPTNTSESIYANDEFYYTIQSGLNATNYLDFFEPATAGSGFDLSDSPLPSPAVGTNGTTYVVSAAGIVFAFTNGVIKWTYDGINKDGFGGRATPAIGLDGNIYVATDDGANDVGGLFYCIDPDLGLPKWKLLLTAPGDLLDMDASPLCASAGIYDIDERGFLHSITYLGQEFPVVSVGESFPGSSPAMTADGLLWAAGSASPHGSGILQIVNTNIQLQAQQPEFSLPLDTSEICASPVVGPDGNIYVGTVSGNFFAIKHTTCEPAQIIAEISLGTQVFPTTACIGSDSRVYVGTSADRNGSGPGSLFSMHLQTVCGQNLPYQFVIDWQKQVSDGGFIGSPLIAQVGVNNSTNVIYAPNADGNIYAFLASAGPSTNTWSTFHGNDQRQGNWNPLNQTPAQPTLWSIQFGPQGVVLNQTGKAAYGNSATDYWNPAPIANNSPQVSLPTVITYSQGGPPISVATLSGSDFSGAIALDDPFNDNLMTNFVYSPSSFIINIGKLPTAGLTQGSAALYDVYVYAYGGTAGGKSINSKISIAPSANDPVLGTVSTQTTSATPPTDFSHFNEGEEYVVFRNVEISGSSPNIQITADFDPNNLENSLPLINGIQIVAKQ